ncbi:hypothetical protein N7510_003235 [Penicillium lagena]|uniref:uncharacterized protein n=1 Tax=Penicillium lagena TaxID=94218 RepID=UPI002541DBD6|nr:uncharacterized protein N7510_003235 [Penicillium lagena]KAJ5619251.1 hypothetical protein N7510_003235 [Penicillium lagena]
MIAVTLMYRTHLEYRITSHAALHYEYALCGLRQALSMIENEQNSGQLDSILASLFMLIWFEILARDWHKWNVHLQILTHLITSLDGARAFDSRFRRRLILATARLEVPNMLWTLHPPILGSRLYEQMLFSYQPYPEDDMEDAAVLAFHRLHVIMARFAIPYADWMRGGLTRSAVRACMADILEQLKEWHYNLPFPLQRLGNPSSLTTRPRTPLQTTLFIHYLSTKLFVMHVLDPNCSVPGDSAYQFCREVSWDICRLVADLGPPEKRSTASFRGDVGVILPLAVVSMFLREEAERAWICQWARRVDQEGMWCGRRRSMIIEAWAICAQEHSLALPFHTMVGQDNIHWKPGQKLKVSIMTYDAAQDWRSSVEVYMDDEDPPATSV